MDEPGDAGTARAIRDRGGGIDMDRAICGACALDIEADGVDDRERTRDGPCSRGRVCDIRRDELERRPALSRLRGTPIRVPGGDAHRQTLSKQASGDPASEK